MTYTSAAEDAQNVRPVRMVSVRAEASLKAMAAGLTPCREVSHDADCPGGCTQPALLADWLSMLGVTPNKEHFK